MEKKDIKEMTRKDWLALPVREWRKVGEYSQIALVPSYELHDSGWRLIAIVGLDEHAQPIEIAAYCDDVEWVSLVNDSRLGFLHMDMIPKTNICRYHLFDGKRKFRVGLGCSTTTIEIV